MREIKFRAWRQEEKTMSNIFDVIDDTREIDYDLDIVMQYTGLHDKNGKEIYEGDIVDTPYDKSYIRWERGGFVFANDGNDGLFCMDESEVIGNIYENPELLK